MEVDRGAVLRIAAGGWVVENGGGLGDWPEAVGLTRCEKMRVRGEHFLSQLLQGSDVVEDPEASPIRGERQIMEALLNGDPVDRRMWQLRLQRLPILSIVKRD